MSCHVRQALRYQCRCCDPARLPLGLNHDSFHVRLESSSTGADRSRHTRVKLQRKLAVHVTPESSFDRSLQFTSHQSQASTGARSSRQTRVKLNRSLQWGRTGTVGCGPEVHTRQLAVYVRLESSSTGSPMHGRVGANGAFRVGTQGPLSEAAAASDGQIDVPAHIDTATYLYCRRHRPCYRVASRLALRGPPTITRKPSHRKRSQLVTMFTRSMSVSHLIAPAWRRTCCAETSWNLVTAVVMRSRATLSSPTFVRASASCHL